MDRKFPIQLVEATRLVGGGRLMEATAAIQAMLGGASSPSGAATVTIEGTAEYVAAPDTSTHAAMRAFMAKLPGLGLRASVPGKEDGPAAPADGAAFLSETFSNGAGSRSYKLYVPSGYRAGAAVPLIVMLHGCTQSPDDFAAGTCMNEAAEKGGFLVAYPGQTSKENMHKCWNWFRAGDQKRGDGEPSLIAGITRTVMADYSVDPRRVYVAGLSAGGAAAAIMGDAYPDLYAAIGVHSGLACGAARDVHSALGAMRQGSPGSLGSGGGRLVPAIIFHGDADSTVNLKNGEAVASQSAKAATLSSATETGSAPGGHGFTKTVMADASGNTVIEKWIVHGGGHAWSGGSPAGTYTDRKGPDATAEMVRFFLEHPMEETRG